ncbi:hypothetical protein [Rhizobium leguminosarum]|uniref:hypothetical protein n=1 Tax=Rhizobium leguminosarum TaxID=384 RepID=UPI0015FABF49|nr:hypothetical protein [Rhizobium leguminosarum]MBA9030398.1 hypothetical protein [Rhizobium leguminosarum]
MSFRSLGLSSLIVNSANDRHGELENETAAIGWLFNNREIHMRNLAKDIVAQGGVYDPPLVSSDGNKFIVFDGNRRVTCLKLLASPKRAPTIELQRFFSELRDKWPGQFPENITCQVESDRDRIDEILYRRHTGTQNGVGQSTWDDRMKANFVGRTGKASGVHVADEIERRLSEANLWDRRRKIPRSNMNRLLSSEAYRNRLGFSVARGHFEYTRDEPAVLKALLRVAEDLTSKKVVLGDIWDVAGKRQYLDQLETEGALPTAQHIPAAKPTSMPSTKKLSAVSPPPKPTPPPKPDLRTTLIPDYLPYAVTWSGEQQRLKAIWEELQFRLKLSEHPNAVAVMFRVLVELALDNYVSKTGLQTVHNNDSLSNRAGKVATDLFAKKKIDKKYYDECKRLQNGDQLFSVATMNRWVHSSTFNPSPQHLTSMWDSISDMVVLCINA